MKPEEFIDELWGYAADVPMDQHPWFAGIINHRWTREQIILGEVQHYLRVRTNPIFFGYMAVNAVAAKQYAVMDTILENFMEELGSRPTHVDIMLQFLEEGGISRAEADNAEPAPGTLAAIEMIIGCCQRRSALEGVAMLAFVESQLGGDVLRVGGRTSVAEDQQLPARPHRGNDHLRGARHISARLIEETSLGVEALRGQRANLLFKFLRRWISFDDWCGC